MHQDVKKFQNIKKEMKRTGAIDEMGEVHSHWIEFESCQNTVYSGVISSSMGKTVESDLRGNWTDGGGKDGTHT